MAASAAATGKICTFYSYKGGVGRSMALVNVAALLSKWNRRVLIIDWDLEAPGVEEFFEHDSAASTAPPDVPGVVDLVESLGRGRRLEWKKSLTYAQPFDQAPRIAILGAGRQDLDYVTRVQTTDWARLFTEVDLGSYLEELRTEWLEEFDFVLVDSRTGITDIGGICTIHLPDILVGFFTSNWASLRGVIDVVRRARGARDRLPYDRGRLLAVPVPARDESRTEYEKAMEWRRSFAGELGEFYADWLPKGMTPADALEVLRIPYIPYWSFGNPLPVVEEGITDPNGVGYYYGILAGLIDAGLAWEGTSVAETGMPRTVKEDPAGAVYARGLALKERGDVAEAEKAFRAAAESGLAGAAYSLGLLLRERGAHAEAEAWLRRAAQAGESAAAANLGLLLAERGETVEAERWLRQAADRGDRAAEANLAVLLRERGDIGAIESKEVRLGLVLDGGSSLAIYTHGSTREIHRLARASALFDLGLGPERSSPSEQTYAQLLGQMADEDPQGVRTRIVVDALSSTSLGGINGVFLAKALAHNRSLDSLRDLWLERGDIRVLLQGPRWIPIRLRASWLLLGGVRRAPLRGGSVTRWLFDALEAMDAGGADPAELESLMPRSHSLDLFVTVTDFYGYNRRIPIASSTPVDERRHRHVLAFRYGDGRDDFGVNGNAALAFSARATSSVSGAFPPVSVDAFEGDLRKWDARITKDVDAKLFRLYSLSGADPRDTYFIDGGVVDDQPFRSILEAVRRRPATGAVERRILYVEPDPPSASAGRRPAPGPVLAVAGASGPPRNDAILDGLLDVASQNENVRWVRDIIETSFHSISERLERVLGPLSDLPSDPGGELIAQWRAALDAEAMRDAGLAYASYVRLRARRVIERYADVVCVMLDYPREGSHASVVRGALRSWAEQRGLLTRELPPRAEQTDFLRSFDLEYAERRLRFVLAGVRWSSRDSAHGKPGFPSRAVLNALTTRLSEAVERLTSALGNEYDAELAGAAVKCLGPAEVADALRSDRYELDLFVRGRSGAFDDLAKRFRVYLGSRLSDFDGMVSRDLLELTSGGEPQWRADVLVRYLGFPLWDVLLYPTEAFAGSEMDHVEILRLSPLDAFLLKPPNGRKLRGVKLQQFGGFFDRSARENDYLWGRLDGAERLLDVLLGRSHPSFASWCQRAFAAILEEEEHALPRSGSLIAALREQILRV